MIDVYLNDHLAGSEFGLELLARIESLATTEEIRAFARRLREEISTDRDELVKTMEKLGVARSLPRAAAGWIAEKALALKLAFDRGESTEFRLFEAFEAMGIGVEGRKRLFKALAVSHPKSGDFDRLVQRAQRHADEVEAMRLSLAPKARAPKPK